MSRDRSVFIFCLIGFVLTALVVCVPIANSMVRECTRSNDHICTFSGKLQELAFSSAILWVLIGVFVCDGRDPLRIIISFTKDMIASFCSILSPKETAVPDETSSDIVVCARCDLYHVEGLFGRHPESGKRRCMHSRFTVPERTNTVTGKVTPAHNGGEPCRDHNFLGDCEHFVAKPPVPANATQTGVTLNSPKVRIALVVGAVACVFLGAMLSWTAIWAGVIVGGIIFVSGLIGEGHGKS